MQCVKSRRDVPSRWTQTFLNTCQSIAHIERKVRDEFDFSEIYTLWVNECLSGTRSPGSSAMKGYEMCRCVIVVVKIFVMFVWVTLMHFIITLPTAAVAKYCDEHVCVFVCLSARTSPEPRARSLPNFLCILPTAMAQSLSGRLKRFQGKAQFWEFSSLLTMHCTAYHLGPIQKRLNRSRCRFGWWVGLARGTMC